MVLLRCLIGNCSIDAMYFPSSFSVIKVGIINKKFAVLRRKKKIRNSIMGDRSNQIGLAITLLLGCVIHIVIGQRVDPTPKTFDSGNNVRLRVNNLKRPEIEKAKYYFQMAAATYCTNRTRLANWTCAYCPRNGSDIRLVTFLEDKLRATFGFVAVDSLRNEILVSFRGSANLKNFIEDFLFPPVPMPREDPRIQVHAGFYTTAMSLYNQVVSALRTLLRSRPNYRVVLTGHSLGESNNRQLPPSRLPCV